MKITTVLGPKGELVAAHHGAIKRTGDGEAGLHAGPGQVLLEVDVPDHVANTKDPHQFEAAIRPHLPKR